MEISLIIPRHPYRSLRDGAKRESLHLSPEGVQALDRLATCSRSAAADLAIRVLDAVVFGKRVRLAQELAKMLDDDGMALIANGFEDMSYALDANLKVPIPN